MSKDLWIKFFHIFTANGWKSEGIEDDLHKYSLVVLADYETKVYACVAEDEKGIEICGDLGVLWLEGKYEYADRPLTLNQLEDAKQGIINAQNNLLAIGIPFCSDYKFYGKNTYNKTRKNEKTRKIWGIDKYATQLIKGEKLKKLTN